MSTPSLPKRYEVRSLLGEGGQGRVYRVQDSIRDRELALKLVTPAESGFLRREFDTLRQIRHENLIQVFDWGTLPGGEAYYTMELVEGGDWSRRMGKPQPADEVRRILTGLLRGLAHLHCHGEIHGDLKPENVLLDAGGVVKITDTGMGGRGGSGSGMSGTAGYAAPEVWEGAAANVRSDLYSVGVMGYEALTGRHPFEGRTVRQVVTGQLEGWVASPGAHGSPVPADLERVLMRALERQPGLRQAGGDEFMEGFGVKDRIGEILGGKLVGREEEIARIDGLLSTTKPGSPTLLYIRGEPGIGKSALLEEAGARLLSRGGRSLEIELAAHQSIFEQIREYLSPDSERPMRDQELPDLGLLLFQVGRATPILIHGSGPLDRPARNYIVNLARYVWALSLEQGVTSSILFALFGTGTEEPFANELSLSPLDQVGCEQLVVGSLGQARLRPEFVTRLHLLSGGNPGVLRASLGSLLDGGVLGRRDGIWAFRELAQINSLRLEGGANPWSVSWRHLSREEQRIVLGLTLFGTPVSSSRLEDLLERNSLDAAISALLAKGWVRAVRAGWSTASEGIRQAVDEAASKELQEEIATAILNGTRGNDPEETIDIELRYRPAAGVLEKGILSAERASSAGDQRSAIDRLRLCIKIATRSGAVDRVQAMCVRAATLLHELGDFDGASGYLSEKAYWADTAESSETSASRYHLLGKIAMSKGDLNAARGFLASAITVATRAGSTTVLLRCHADLAEMEWRHGDESQRGAAIRRMQEVLNTRPKDSGKDEIAALMYQLGAATVFAGESSESIHTLVTAFELADSDYWRMRTANALGVAFHSLRDYERELEWSDRAWKLAEASGADTFKARILSNKGAWYLIQGRVAEASDSNRLSAAWARRFGSTFEYAAGCAGSAMCDIHLAKYESAIENAKEVRGAAETLNDYTYLVKACEIEGLANYHIGRTDAAENGVREALSVLGEHGYTVVGPRLEWLLAKILRRRGSSDEVENLLGRAEAQLLKTKDAEDLSGVQVEIVSFRVGNGNAATSLHRIESLFRAAESAGLSVIAAPAVLAMAEIIHEQGLNYGEYRAVLARGLEIAQHAGMREVAWQLSYRMGALAIKGGERKESYSRLTLASRVLREIASDLNDANRRCYLDSAHIKSALREMDLAIGG